MNIKPGDWCFFYNTGEPIVFGQFSVKSGAYYYARNHCSRTPRFEQCIKYFGLIPNFKDKEKK